MQFFKGAMIKMYRYKEVILFFILLFSVGACSTDNQEFRTIDGTENNTSLLDLNSAFTALNRIMKSDYADKISSMAGEERPNPRVISNVVFDQENTVINELHATDFLWQWGQFLDHDIDLTSTRNSQETANILVPVGDIFFDPLGFGTVEITFNRSIFDNTTGTNTSNPRQCSLPRLKWESVWVMLPMCITEWWWLSSELEEPANLPP